MKRLVSGTTGFIGFHLGKRIFQRSDEVVGLAKSYDHHCIRIKYAHLKERGIEPESWVYDNTHTSDDYHRYCFIKGNLGKLNSKPSTPIISGIEAFVPRFREFYGIK